MLQTNDNLSRELNELFLMLSKSLDITKTQYDNLTRSYSAVGKYLEEDPELSSYHPVITPQGSLRLGTIIQPINEEDDLDVDLVYRLIEKWPTWTQFDLKTRVGNRLKSHSLYKEMLDKEGRRCWTLLYRQNSDNNKERYHMDILPCVAESTYLERFHILNASGFDAQVINDISIRITDNKCDNYKTSICIKEWMKSNPDGYAMWFASRCNIMSQNSRALLENVVPVRKYVENKTILQRIVQILKRHRDVMFNGDKDKPISIIITTLAAKAYKGEDNLFIGLNNVIDGMESEIHKNQDGTYIIENPVNFEENFADKWTSHPNRRDNFFRWLGKLKSDKDAFINCKGSVLRNVFALSFGEKVTNLIFEKRALEHKAEASNSKLKVSSTGIIGAIGTTLNAKNTFFGEK